MTGRMLDGATVACDGREFTVHDEPPDEDGHGAYYYTCDTCDGTVRGSANEMSDHECPPACPYCGQRDEDAHTETDSDGCYVWQCCGTEQLCPCGSGTSTNHRFVCTAWITP